MRKCDVIIPVYNAPEYVEMCMFALVNNTEKEDLGTIFLLDDKSNKTTSNLLDNLYKKYKDKVNVKVVHNKNNLGFIKNVNNGFKLSKEKYVMLLNTDCFVSKNTVGKLMEHMEANEKIGLICPICSNAANLTLEMFDGFSYTMMDKLLESKFKGMNFDACTVVGNCLMISRKCIDEVGYLDEIYGMGYGDETDYQFKSMEKGFEAKVAIDTYVFHKAEQSFNTTNKMRSERLEKNRKIFFDRWGDKYYALLEEYEKNDPIKYIKEHLTKEDKIADLDYTFVLPQMGNGAGGVIYISDLVNYLNILGMNVGMLNIYAGEYSGIMAYKPLGPKNIGKFKSNCLVATIFDSVFLAKKMCEKMGSKLVYFSQGYEFMFLEGTRYGEVESSFKIVDYVVTISDYLKNSYKKLFNIDAIKIVNGIDYNILHQVKTKKTNKRKHILMNMRNEALKGGFILNDVLKKLTVEFNDIDITVVNNCKKYDFAINNNSSVNVNIINGPISRTKMYDLLYDADVLVDASLSEGFGLLPLEAMACGVVPVVSNAMGNTQYCVNNKNAILVDAVNNSDEYINKIKKLFEDNKKFENMKNEAILTSSEYDFENVVCDFYKSLDDILNNNIKPINYKMNKSEKEKVEKYLYTDEMYNRLLFSSKSNYYHKNNRTRNLKILAKEFVKANVYLLKQTYKTIRYKNHRL